MKERQGGNALGVVVFAKAGVADHGQGVGDDGRLGGMLRQAFGGGATHQTPTQDVFLAEKESKETVGHKILCRFLHFDASIIPRKTRCCQWKIERKAAEGEQKTGAIFFDFSFVGCVEKCVHNLDTMNKNKGNGNFVVQNDMANPKSK